MTEQWRPVPGWPQYAVSPTGEVLSLPRVVVRRSGTRYTVRCARILKPAPQRTSGALTVMLYRPGHHRRMTVAKLVADVWGDEENAA